MSFRRPPIKEGCLLKWDVVDQVPLHVEDQVLFYLSLLLVKINSNILPWIVRITNMIRTLSTEKAYQSKVLR
jgi:hypothetical protein